VQGFSFPVWAIAARILRFHGTVKFSAVIPKAHRCSRLSDRFNAAYFIAHLSEIK
jgi:hypothetical protein